jgi:hypothetical protein
MHKALICGIWVLAAVSVTAATPPAEIRWNELAVLIVGHRVTIPLPGGGTVQGEALSVREDSLVLDISRSSDTSRFPKGQTPIPRTSVTELRLAERNGAGGRILGTVVGTLGGAVAGAEIALHGNRSQGAAVSTFTATAIAGTVAGYFAGRAVDRHSRLLHIAPLAEAGAR